MENCIFCKIIRRDIPGRILWENETLFALLDIYPVNSGHILLLPKAHIDYIFDLPQSIYQEMMETARIVAPSLRESTSCCRIGIAVEGFSVPHVHVHLVPLHAGNELDPNRAKHVPKTELDEMFDLLKRKLIFP